MAEPNTPTTMAKELSRQRYQAAKDRDDKIRKLRVNRQTAFQASTRAFRGAGKKMDSQGAESTGRGLENFAKRGQRDIRQEQNIARNSLKNLTKGNLQKQAGLKAEDVAKVTTKESSRIVLNTLWAGVWADWTTLTLWALNLYLFSSLIFKRSMAQFGEDDVFGTWMGGGRVSRLTGSNSKLAFYIEILIVAILDVIVISLILFLIFILYKLVVAYQKGWLILAEGLWYWVKSGGDREAATFQAIFGQ